jgi:hypothetical protein
MAIVKDDINRVRFERRKPRRVKREEAAHHRLMFKNESSSPEPALKTRIR